MPEEDPDLLTQRVQCGHAGGGGVMKSDWLVAD